MNDWTKKEIERMRESSRRIHAEADVLGLSKAQWHGIEEQVADAMIEHGPDGHIDGYQEIARVAVLAYLGVKDD